MTFARRSLALSCVALVLLPMPPCAVLPGMCGGRAVAKEQEPQPARPCCLEHGDQGADASHHGKPSTPCERGCCRLNEIAPLVQKVEADHAIAWAPALVALVIDQMDCGRDAPAFELLPPVDSLQSLHCLWRC